MAIVKAGIERFPDKEIVAEAEAVLKEIQDDVITHLKGGGRTIPPKGEPLLPWLLNHPNIKNRVVRGWPYRVLVGR